MRLVATTKLFLTLTFGLGLCGRALGQAAAAVPQQQVLTVIDADPLSSPRANAMGGAIGTVADDMDAAMHNPAGIGGLADTPKNAPLVRKLYFPWVAVGANENSLQLYNSLQAGGANKDAAAGEAVVDANAGKRDYARASIATGVVLGRFMIVPFDDEQMATTPRGGGSNLLDTTYRSMSGIGYGFSARDAQNRFSIGYFGYTVQRSDTNGAFQYSDLDDQTARNKVLAADTMKTTGSANDVGAIWKMGKAWSPTLGLNVKNVGNTTYKGSSGEIVDKQEVDASFSLGPKVGKTGAYNLVLETDRLTDDNVSFEKKYKVGTELCLGGLGSYATFALRAGYNYAGPSGGLMLNLGLISLEASVYSVDLGAGNVLVSERRESATMRVNVADF